MGNSRFPLRGLVNCAGIGWIGSSIDFPADEARKIIDVNLMGTMICAQAAARLVQEHDLSASFVFIASMSGYVVNKVAFVLSKAFKVLKLTHPRVPQMLPTLPRKRESSSSRATLLQNGAIPRPATAPPSESTLSARASSVHL